MPSPKMFDNTCCRWCVKTVKWIPVLFIVTIVVWSYYAYVIQLCLFTVDSIAEKVIFLLFFHVIFALFAWAYWQTIFAEVGRVPRQFRISEVEAEKLLKELSVENQRRMLDVLARNMPITCRTATGCVRYCEKCRYIKPDRAHHCSACGECILKMDHHCPWVNNCVAFTNYKFFILFLMYSLVYCIYIASTSLPYFIKFWKNELNQAGRFHILFLFFMALMFGISLLSLFGYHCYLVAVNRTTLESFRAPVFRTGPDKSGFDLGVTKNIEQVFGEVRWKWFLPLFTSLGDGILYPTRNPQNIASSYNSMGSTLTSVGSGMSFPKRVNEEDADELLGQRQRWAEEGLDERRRPEQSSLFDATAVNANDFTNFVNEEEV